MMMKIQAKALEEDHNSRQLSNNLLKKILVKLSWVMKNQIKKKRKKDFARDVKFY